MGGLSGRAREIQDILDRLTKKIPAIQGALLLNREGLVMVSTEGVRVEEDGVAALASGMTSVSERFLRDLDWGKFSSLLITSEKGYILMKNVGEEEVLAVIITADVDWMKVHGVVNWALSTLDFLGEGTDGLAGA